MAVTQVASTVGRMPDGLLWDDALKTLAASNFPHFVYVYLVRNCANLCESVRI